MKLIHHRNDLFHLLARNSFAPLRSCSILLRSSLLHFQCLPFLLVQSNKNTSPHSSSEGNLENKWLRVDKDDSATTNTVAAAAAHLDSFVRHHLERRRRCVIEHSRSEPPKKGAKATFTVHQAHGLRNTKFPANFALGLQARLDDIKRIGYLRRKHEGAEDAQEGSNWKNDVPSCWTILRQLLRRSVWRE